MKRFLEEHPEEVKKTDQDLVHRGEHERRGTKTGMRIAHFLGWKTFRVDFSLERLGLIDEGIVDPEAIVLPTYNRPP
jgi:hypothetical protein